MFEIESVLLVSGSTGYLRPKGIMWPMQWQSPWPAVNTLHSGWLKGCFAVKASEFVHRACVACGNIYFGPLKCPDCGEPGEPLLFFGDKEERAMNDDHEQAPTV